MKKMFLKSLPTIKKVGSYSIIGIALVGGFLIGRHYEPNKVEEKHNPYSHAFDPSEISIAVNESNELLIIEKATGNYIVYSDEVGMTIFKMYTNRIYQKANEN